MNGELKTPHVEKKKRSPIDFRLKVSMSGDASYFLALASDNFRTVEYFFDTTKKVNRSLRGLPEWAQAAMLCSKGGYSLSGDAR